MDPCPAIKFNESDTDGDNVIDCADECPYDPLKTKKGISFLLAYWLTMVGVCNCSVSDIDSDNDTVADCNDACPNDPSVVRFVDITFCYKRSTCMLILMEMEQRIAWINV